MNRDEAAKGVPGGVNPDLAKALVQKLGVTKIVATVEDPDSGECEMHGGNELAESFGLSEEQARAFWDSSKATVARGECKGHPPEDSRFAIHDFALQSPPQNSQR